jgi:hypothetical protein
MSTLGQNQTFAPQNGTSALLPKADTQRPTFYRVGDYQRVLPDDVLRLLKGRDARQRADIRTEAQRWLGDPPPWRSALAMKRQEKPRSATPVSARLRFPRARRDPPSFVSVSAA